MAPEQLLGTEIDARTDIHAAGAVLYGIATGQHPFAWVEGSGLVGAILHRQPPPASDLNPRLSQRLAQIIGKCMEKQPENRYQSAKELAVDLRRLARDEKSQPIAQAPPLVSGKSSIARQKRLFALASTVVILLVLTTILLSVLIRKGADSLRISPSIAVLPFVDLSAEKKPGIFLRRPRGGIDQ